MEDEYTIPLTYLFEVVSTHPKAMAILFFSIFIMNLARIFTYFKLKMHY